MHGVAKEPEGKYDPKEILKRKAHLAWSLMGHPLQQTFVSSLASRTTEDTRRLKLSVGH